MLSDEAKVGLAKQAAGIDPDATDVESVVAVCGLVCGRVRAVICCCVAHLPEVLYVGQLSGIWQYTKDWEKCPCGNGRGSAKPGRLPSRSRAVAL